MITTSTYNFSRLRQREQLETLTEKFYGQNVFKKVHHVYIIASGEKRHGHI